VEDVEMHDGSVIRLAKLHADYDPHDRIGATSYLHERAAEGEIVTGLIFIEEGASDLHANLNTVAAPLNKLGEKDLCPGSKALDAFNAAHR
jgi:2-oxoglutarate ferredoxin oxidoreductase subunit beta